MGLVDCTMSKGPADQTHHMKGRLHVEVVEARGLKDLDTWGKMSPACSVQIGKQFQRTKKHKLGHVNPEWNATLEPFVIDTEKDQSTAEMHIRVFDKDSRMGSEFVTNIGGDYEKVVMGAHDPSQIDTHDEMHAVHQSGGLPDHH